MEAFEDPPRAEEFQPASWPLILLAGGGAWLVVTATALLWLHPMSGRLVGNQYYLSSPARAMQHLLVFTVSTLAYRLTFSFRTPGYRTEPLRFCLLQIALAVTVIRLAPFAGGIASGLVDQRMEDLRDTADYWRPFNPEFSDWLTPLQFFLPPYLLGLVMIGALQMAREYHRESLRATRLWAAYAEARLAMLSAQLQPHFLFNSLHAIAELIYASPDRAQTMLARLGDFLRHALESSKQPWVSVATEMAGLEAYLAVQQTRFRDQLSIAISVDPAAAALAMPSMLLQPLAENAVEHGRDVSAAPLLVTITVAVSGDRLQVTIHNNTPRLALVLPPAAYGIGLANVAARLHAAYGGDATLQVGPDARGGTTAALDIPRRHAT